MNLPKSIIMITLDCVRPDHIGYFGYKGVATQNIDKIAEEGVFFTQAIAQAPNTWVSHASIFTGCYPFNHSIRTPYNTLSNKVKTLAEVLSENGFATGGFPSHTLLGKSQNFNRGFDLYDLDSKNFLHSSTSKGNYFYRPWNSMWKKTEEWMLKQSTPFFAWVHYMGTHWEPENEISLPVNYREKYSSAGQYYNGKISWADHICIEKVRDFIKKNNLSDDSIVIIFSDHGDVLSKNETPYKYGGHNDNLVDEVMRILLIFRAPGLIPSGILVREQVRSIDIMPTLLDIIGIPPPANIDGVSIVSTFNEEEKNTNQKTKFAYMENLPKGWLAIRTEEYKLILKSINKPKYKKPSNSKRTKKELLFSNKKPAILYKFLGLCFKIIKSFYSFVKKPLQKLSVKKKQKSYSFPDESKILREGRIFALYDLKKDPEERYNIADSYRDIVNDLKQELVNMIKTTQRDLNQVTDNERKKISQTLKNLGYY